MDAVEVEVFWNASGEIQLKVGKKLAAKGTSPGFLTVEPGDSLQVGADLIKPVGEYESGTAFEATISGLHYRSGR